MSLELLIVGKNSEDWINDLELQYQKKIKQFAPFKLTLIKGRAVPRDRADEKVLDESNLVLEHLSSKDFTVLFDERGKDYDSLKFSKALADNLEANKNIVLIVGGAFGVNDEVKKRANLTVKLSSMTMNHLIARAVVLEQVYRAMTIWKRFPYHNA